AASESWGSSLPIHPEPASDEMDVWLERLQPIVQLYDPARLPLLIASLYALGLSDAVLCRGRRLALLPGLVPIILILAAVGMVGAENRFRLPADPLICLLTLASARSLTSRLATALPRLAARTRSRSTRPGEGRIAGHLPQLWHAP